MSNNRGGVLRAATVGKAKHSAWGSHRLRARRNPPARQTLQNPGPLGKQIGCVLKPRLFLFPAKAPTPFVDGAVEPQQAVPSL